MIAAHIQHRHGPPDQALPHAHALGADRAVAQPGVRDATQALGVERSGAPEHHAGCVVIVVVIVVVVVALRGAVLAQQRGVAAELGGDGGAGALRGRLARRRRLLPAADVRDDRVG